MIIFKIVQTLVLLGVFAVLIGIAWEFIKDTRVYRRRMRKLDQWSRFHSQLMDWSKEIQDDEVRVNFINHCVHKLVQTGNDKLSKNMLDDWSIDLEKIKICDEWGKHIPSLIQEVREKKLNQIL
jgi:hypothetical protein